jgi:hypothetical protein
MTDIAKAIAFATHCLGWETPTHVNSCWIYDLSDDSREFDVRRAEKALTEFLGKRYFIQINRGTTTVANYTRAARQGEFTGVFIVGLNHQYRWWSN